MEATYSFRFDGVAQTNENLDRGKWMNRCKKRGKTYVSGLVDGTAHDDDLLNTQEGLGVSRSRRGNIRQGTNSHDGDGIPLVFTKQTEHLLVSGLLGGSEELVLLLDLPESSYILRGHVLRGRREKRLPSLGRAKVRVLYNCQQL